MLIQTPKKATIIENNVVLRSVSPKIKYPAIAAMKGIAASINKVTAAVVIVIEKIKPVKAVAKNIPPKILEIPIRKKFL